MEAVRTTELERALRRVRHLSPDDRAQLEQFSHTLLNMFLHQPTIALKEAARAGRGTGSWKRSNACSAWNGGRATNSPLAGADGRPLPSNRHRQKAAMPTISKDNKLLTLINVFTVEPAKQQQLVALLIYARKLK